MMVYFDRIINLAKRLANMILKGGKIERADVESHLLTDEDRDYVIEHLSDAEKMEARNRLAREIHKSRNEDWQRVEAAIHPPGLKVRRLHLWGRAAAIFIGCIAAGYLLLRDRHPVEKEWPENIQHITLQLPDGNIRVLKDGTHNDIRDEEGRVVGILRDNRIDYKKENRTSSPDTAYHVLRVPFGKTFELVLSDGTRVNLNAGSSLKYPAHFKGEGNRNVSLEGEAFFDVKKNPLQPFIVGTGDMNVRVLGTKFVINSYKEESRIRTVLLEGSVALFGKEENYDPEKAALLAPGQKATWHKDRNDISFEEVDTDLYTGWMEGKLIFSHIPFSEILRRLERHYNTSIINKNGVLDQQVFTAGFEGESIESVLNAFRRNYAFEYTVSKDSTIIIN